VHTSKDIHTYLRRELACNAKKMDTDGARTDVVEGPPTADQLGSILEYLGPSKAGTVVKDATGSSDALRKFNAHQQVFQRPVIVDWNNGRAGTYTPHRRRR